MEEELIYSIIEKFREICGQKYKKGILCTSR